MKKILAIILAIGMVLSLAACGGNSSDGGRQQRHPDREREKNRRAGTSGNDLTVL